MKTDHYGQVILDAAGNPVPENQPLPPLPNYEGLMAELQARRNEVKHQSQIILALRAEIGKPPEGSHPDEQVPRAATWHKERLNWIVEVEKLRSALNNTRNSQDP